MEKITNFDELKRMHEWARITKPGSKDWIEFATTMFDSFPAIYETAKAMNERMATVRKDTLEEAIETAKRCKPEDTVEALCRLRLLDMMTPNA